MGKIRALASINFDMFYAFLTKMYIESVSNLNVDAIEFMQKELFARKITCIKCYEKILIFGSEFTNIITCKKCGTMYSWKNVHIVQKGIENFLTYIPEIYDPEGNLLVYNITDNKYGITIKESINSSDRSESFDDQFNLDDDYDDDYDDDDSHDF